MPARSIVLLLVWLSHLTCSACGTYSSGPACEDGTSLQRALPTATLELLFQWYGRPFQQHADDGPLTELQHICQ
jgi:hypothetical protein